MGSEAPLCVVLNAPATSATVADLRAALAKQTGYDEEAQHVIFQGKPLQQGDKPLREVFGVSFVTMNETFTVHVAVRPGAEKAKKKTLVEALRTLEESASKDATLVEAPGKPLLRALGTLQKIVDNICDHPHEEKYRSVKTTNQTFHASLGHLAGGVECLLGLGFEKVGDTVKLEASEQSWNRLVMGRKILLAARRKAARAALERISSEGCGTPEDFVAKAALDAKDAVIVEVARGLLGERTGAAAAAPVTSASS